jgi:hypothetical protein
MAERADDAVEERFATDEAGARRSGGLPGEMFACAKADLQPQRTILAEQSGGIQRAILGHGDPRQQIFNKRRLPLAKLVALGASIKSADRSGIVHPAAR